MEIKNIDYVDYPLDVVYQTLRDRLPEVANFFPNVKAIEEKSREVMENKVKIINLWHGKGIEIPMVAQSILKPEVFSWIDKAVWDNSKYICEWEIETFYKESISCKGTNYFIAEGNNKTLVKVLGDLTIKNIPVPGVPKFLEKTIIPQIEKFIIKLVTPNFTSLTKSLSKFLDSQRGK